MPTSRLQRPLDAHAAAVGARRRQPHQAHRVRGALRARVRRCCSRSRWSPCPGRSIGLVFADSGIGLLVRYALTVAGAVALLLVLGSLASAVQLANAEDWVQEPLQRP